MAAPPQPRELVYDGDVLPIRIYSDGTCDRLDEAFLPASFDPSTAVSSKDVDLRPNVSARLYLPSSHTTSKLPVLLYFHGGAFCIETPFSPLYHPYLNSLSSKANVLAISVHYRRVPEHPLPACYDDGWEALQWVASHSGGGGPEAWLNDHADLSHVFLAGDSAGANISHHVAMRAGREGVGDGNGVEGVVLLHPYLWGDERIPGEEGLDVEEVRMLDRVWAAARPAGGGGVWINPVKEGGLEELGCRRVLLCVAGKDVGRWRMREYYEALSASGWGGKVDMCEYPGEEHDFHLYRTSCENASALMERVVSFLNGV